MTPTGITPLLPRLMLLGVTAGFDVYEYREQQYLLLTAGGSQATVVIGHRHCDGVGAKGEVLMAA